MEVIVIFVTKDMLGMTYKSDCMHTPNCVGKQHLKNEEFREEKLVYLTRAAWKTSSRDGASRDFLKHLTLTRSFSLCFLICIMSRVGI